MLSFYAEESESESKALTSEKSKLRSEMSMSMPNTCEHIGETCKILTDLLEGCHKFHGEHQWIESLERNVKQLRTDWMFLRMLFFFVQNAYLGRSFPDRGKVFLDLEPKFSQHARSISVDLKSVFSHYVLSESFINEIDKYQRETDILKSNIVEVLDGYSLSTITTPRYFVDFVSKHYERTSMLRHLLQTIITDDEKVMNEKHVEGLRALYKELELIRKFVAYVNKNFQSRSSFWDAGNPLIVAFLDHVRSVVVRVAIQSCNYWFDRRKVHSTGAESKLNGLVDLHHDIDPLNPNFLELNLNFLNAVREYCLILSIQHKFKLDDGLLRSILTWRGDYELKKEMMILVAMLITSRLDNSREDVQKFFAEITASLSGPLGQGNETLHPPSLHEFRTTICLLKAEHFLKYRLDTNYFSTLDVKKVKLSRVSKDMLLPHEKLDYWKQILELTEFVVNEVKSLYQSFWAKECSASMLKNSLLQLLLKVVIFKAELFLLELLKSNASVIMDCEKFQVESLLAQLKAFSLILTNMLEEDIEEVVIIFPQVEAFARSVTLLSYSFLQHKITEGTIKKIIFSFPELLDKAQRIKAKLKEISPQFPVSALPKANGLGFIDFLSRNLGELLKRSPKSIASVKNHIEEVQVHMKSFLMKVSDSDMENPGLKDLFDHMIDVAYKVDYVVDLIEVDTHWQHFFWFLNLLEELRLVVKQASNLQVTTSDAKAQTANNFTQVSDNMISQDRTPAINEVAVDLVDEEKDIIKRLTTKSPRRDVVSIVGMPGIGKTTLATKVYNSHQIKSHFHRLAWCTVSLVYEKRKVLLEIIKGIQGLTGEILEMSTEELELTLHQGLSRHTYLIVMDDVWSVGDWKGLKDSFPDNYNGSRILLTSRQQSVALEINPDSDPYRLRLFSVDESWKLLEKKVFKGESCPEQLSMIGKKIAQHCEGLPLAIVAIAGLLGRTEKSQSWWTRVAESFSSQLIPETRCMEIIELSYKYLPEHLKACFLYLGFLEGNHIPVTKIIRFWLAEGFIKSESNNLEDVAEKYLMDLIDSSLVNTSKIRSNGKVKECRLHDLLRDFCRSKAKEEKFFQLVNGSDEPYASFPGLDHDIEFDDDYHLDPVTFESYRLSITLKRSHFVDSRPSGPSTRSLIFFACTDPEPRCPYDISFISDNFKFLRVLDLECINMGSSFPAEIGLLVRLTYLAVSGYVKSIPESIGNLRKLETLLVQGLRGKVVLPHTIWGLTKLRHLHVTKHVAFSLHEEEAGCSFQLDNLVSFSFLALAYTEDIEKILKRFLNLRKLKCVFKESRDSSKNCNQFPPLNLLTHLESLHIVYPRRALNLREFTLPSSLKQLTLSNCRLPWDHISTIGKLSKLEVLKLVLDAFEGQVWDMKEAFQELKFLKLDTLDIAHWNATSYHLPKLQRLVLQNCKALQNVPSDFADITWLETIEVNWCSQSAEESARKIEKATDEEIKILINGS